MSERLTLVNDLDVSAETGLGGGGEGAEFALERLELKMDSVDVGPHVGRVVRGVVAAVIRAVVTARQKKITKMKQTKLAVIKTLGHALISGQKKKNC